jgi:Bacterial Ig-like domain (group 3)/FG-GAP-like repeat
MLHKLFHDVKTLVLFCSVLSGFAIAQKPVYPTRTQTPPLPVALQRFQTPAQQVLAPFLKAHPMQAASNNGQLHAQDATNYVTSPNFGGYVNAPLYDARTTASLDTGSFNNGVTVELTADFNKDGKPDIAVLQQDGTMNILLGNGSGRFSAPVSYLNPNYLSSSVNNAYAVDVNNDGFTDIIGFDYNNNTMITWLNLGNGTFNAAVTTPLDASNGYPNYVLVQDVNRDGKPDLLFAMSQFVSLTSANIFLEVMTGNGDGTFNTPPSKSKLVQEFSVPASVNLPNYNGIALGDINGDGKLDIAVALDERFSQTTGQYVVTTALGNGDGTFGTLNTTIPISTPSTSIGNTPVPYNSTGVQLVDLNSDGKLDVASDINGALMVALGEGNGSFETAISSNFSQVVSVAQMAFADVNGDGKPDLIAGGDTLGIYLGNGDGTFAAPLTSGQYIVDPTTGQGIALADFNGDGVLDVAQLGSDYKEVALYLGNGTGQFRGAPLVTSASDPEGIDWDMETTGKYTSSGYSDAIFLHAATAGTEMLTGVSDGKGNFTFVQSLAGGVPSDLQYIQPLQADFNGDGNADLVLTGAAGDVTVALSNGDGTFATPVSVNLPSTLACPVYYAAAGDVNGDGKTDLVIPYGGDDTCGSTAGGPSGYFVLLGNGNGMFSAPVFTQVGTELYSATLADINGDGKLDLVLDDAPFVSGSGFSILLATGNGDGTFGSPNTILSNYLVSNVAVADINGDGKADLVLSAEEVEGNGSVATGGILTITGNGDGTFNSPSLIAGGNFFFGMQLADMNNDGNPDIVATLYSTNGQPNTYYGMVTLLGLGNGQFSASVNQLESLASTLPQIGNFYNDGAPDVMTQTGYGPALFLGQGASTVSLAASATSAVFGSSETFTATVTAGMSNRPVPTGSVSFYDGTTLLGSVAITNGSAAFTTASLAVGTHNVLAVYSGDTNFNPATSSPAAVTINALASAVVSLTASASSAVFGSSETFTATVAGTSNGPVPSGSISFYDGSTLLGSVAVANGSAAFTTASLAAGGHSIVATYSGDANFNPATSSPAAVTISVLTPAFSLTGAPATLSIGSGANGVATLNIAANASFSGAVNLSCSGAPSKASCTVNPGSVTLAAGQSTTATLVIGTTTTSADVKHSGAPWRAAGAAASLAMLCGVFFGRRKRVRMLAGLSLAVIVSLGTLLTGCSNGGSTAPATGPTSFTVTITATPASGSTAPAQTTTVNVTVN